MARMRFWMIDKDLFRKAEPLLGEAKVKQLWVAATTDQALARDVQAFLTVLVSEQLGSNYR